jgi:Icc-related predicted phosphoesterase
VIRIAAVADLHFGPDAAGTYRSHLDRIADRADAFLIAGDLTRLGDPEEARILAEELRDLPIPTVAVLGNHDHHADREDEVRAIMESAGVRVLEGEGMVLDIGGARLGIAGAKGFGGGFAGVSASEFGEREMKAFIRHTMEVAGRLEDAVRTLDADRRVVLLHYSPIKETLDGEPPEIHAFLGSYLLAEAIDRAGADLVLHGHAHRGAGAGTTPGGIPVRNVAWPVIGQAYALFRLEPREGDGSRSVWSAEVPGRA